MRLILEHKSVWRAAILVLLLVSFIGPWVFDKLNIPAQYPCTAPVVRLEGDFCGMPMPGLWILYIIVAIPVSIVAEMVTIGAGRPGFGSEMLRSLFVGMGFLLLVLPFFRTLFLVLREDRPRLRVLNWVMWGLAAGMGMWIGLQTPRRIYWELWGVWLFNGLASAAFILELLVYLTVRRPRNAELTQSDDASL